MMMKKTLCALALIGVAATAQAGISENFNNVAALSGTGWILRNDSAPVGPALNWAQGNEYVFTAFAGADNAYIQANYNNGIDGGTIDNWLISPIFSTSNFGDISFWARSDIAGGFADTLSYGLSNGTSAAADFMLSPTFQVLGDWTKYSVHFDGTGANTKGRFAIRYTGDNGAQSSANYVGIDSLDIDLPEPGTPLMLGIGLIGLLAARRRAQR